MLLLIQVGNSFPRQSYIGLSVCCVPNLLNDKMYVTLAHSVSSTQAIMLMIIEQL